MILICETSDKQLTPLAVFSTIEKAKAAKEMLVAGDKKKKPFGDLHKLVAFDVGDIDDYGFFQLPTAEISLE